MAAAVRLQGWPDALVCDGLLHFKVQQGALRYCNTHSCKTIQVKALRECIWIQYHFAGALLL
jgi:hypothetical protein